MRLIDGDGAPSIDGIGRLDIVYSGTWAPVCSSGFTSGAATVACKTMGFSGAEFSAEVLNCKSAKLCGGSAPHVSSVSCAGSSASLLDCKHESGKYVYCAPEETVVIKCVGNGDASGRSPRVPAPVAL